MSLFKLKAEFHWKYARKARRALFSGLGLAFLNPDDIWLACFPRVGSTWLRFIFAHLVSLSGDEHQEVNYRTIEKFSPELGELDVLEPWTTEYFPRFIKTHRTYHSWLMDKPRRILYVLRDPRDIMVSYYHHRLAHRWDPYEGEFDEFIRDRSVGLRGFLRHFQSWNEQADYTIRYEVLKADGHREVSRMLEALGVSMNRSMVERAFNAASLKSMRRIQEERGVRDERRFVESYRLARKGASGNWPDYFTQDDLSYYRRLCSEVGFHLYQNSP